HAPSSTPSGRSWKGETPCERAPDSPLGLRDAAAVVDDPGQDEEQVRQAVDVADEHRVDWRIEADHPALRPPADRARDVQRGAGARAAGEDEAAQRRE